MNRRTVIAVVSDPADAHALPPDRVIPADRYLEGGGSLSDARNLIVNLCRSYGYGSKGYYVSLLADARGQQVLPAVETATGLDDPYARFRALQEAGVPTIDAGEMAARRRACGIETDDAPDTETGAFPPPLVRDPSSVPQIRGAREDECVEVLVCFGTADDTRFQKAAMAVYREWPAPLLRIQMVREDDGWKVAQVAPGAPHLLDQEEQELLARALGDPQRLLRKGRVTARETVRASLAVLVEPENVFAPSTPETIDRLERVAARMNVHIARLGVDELRRLPEYDALFIRSYNDVTHPAFQFALRAEALDMPVVDDSQSTIRCTNKVFMEELLHREGVPTPRTLILTAHTPWDQIAGLGFPFVIKLPDGCFSAAMHKIQSRDEYESHSADLFKHSPLIIAQEWLPTEFDWRIAVLGGKLLFAAKYYMARGHWQIRSVEQGTERYGKVEAVPRDRAPVEVVETALRAAALIGDGFYGVDLKETPKGPVVIEINDNPNLDRGYEDTADGDLIYEDILRFYLNRIEEGANTREMEFDEDEDVARMRVPISRAPQSRSGGYRFFEVAGMELEYPTVDRDLNVVPLVEDAFRALAGRGVSDVDLGAIGFSNEFADHVFEIKLQQPVADLITAETFFVEGMQRFSAVLRDRWDARLLPTGMHPWFDPQKGRLWTRSGLRIYTTYAHLFDVRTHGWMNVQAMHINLPFGDERETIAMHTAAALLIPYLPAIAASTPVHDGVLQNTEDSRLGALTRIQARIPESIGRIVPEYVDSFADYRRRIFQPMYAALDRLPHSEPIRHEFFNARGAILRFNRKAMEIRVIDTQECVKMDVAIAVFVRAAVQALTERVLSGSIQRPPHDLLVDDFHATIGNGSRARVAAPHLDVTAERDGASRAPVRAVLRHLLVLARSTVRPADAAYLDLVAKLIESGSLAERIRERLAPHSASGGDAFRDELRNVYIELADCLDRNEPWHGRGLERPQILAASA